MARRTIAVSGGIGAGKSVVCQVLRALGYEVYDCDREAAAIMDGSVEIKAGIRDGICREAISDDGRILRNILAREVFSSPHKLERLNQLVHSAVRDDVACRMQRDTDGPLFVETAILFSSRMDAMVDEIWWVTAPESMRIERVCRRNGISPEQVAARISAQSAEESQAIGSAKTKPVVNDGRHSILLQINALLNDGQRHHGRGYSRDECHTR